MIFKVRNIFRLCSITTILLLTGCGGGNTFRTSGVAEDGVPTTEGDSLIITTGDGDTNITYVEVEDGSIYIDCGEGGCGDIYIGEEVVVEDVEVDTGGY